MSNPIHVHDDEFETKVIQASVPVVVDFWAPWCGPCRMIAPVLEEIAAKYDGRLLVAKVNADEDPRWAIHYGVQGIPTLLFMANGEVIDRQVGALSASALTTKVEAFLQTTSDPA